LKAYNEALGEFVKLNGQLVAVSPELPDSSLSTKEKDSLKFEVLSDVGNKVAESYGIVYTLPVTIAEYLGERVAAYNGDSTATLPLAITYIIDTNSVIKYAFVDPDYKKRAEPIDIINALKNL
jgi:peroxiredoxin